jgi:hypothetical protein
MVNTPEHLARQDAALKLAMQAADQLEEAQRDFAEPWDGDEDNGVQIELLETEFYAEAERVNALLSQLGYNRRFLVRSGTMTEFEQHLLEERERSKKISAMVREDMAEQRRARRRAHLRIVPSGG